jgi:ribosomal protein L7/L12
MLLMLLVDLFFVGSGVYMFLQGRIVPGVAMVAMGAVATAILALRRAAAARHADASGPRAPGTAATTRLRPEEITLEPALEDEVRRLAKTQRIAAVKLVRDATGSSLKAAVAYVDRLR